MTRTPTHDDDTRNRIRGALIGLAVGDALGTTLEFKRPGAFQPIQDIVGGGPFGLAPGQWTDDTSMALCLAESLIECRGFDPHDQVTRYVKWWREGRLSSTGTCFDIGNTVSAALRHFERTGEPFSGSDDPRSAGNGSIMRLAPVPMLYWRDIEQAMTLSGESSRTTHQAQECIDACRFMGAALAFLIAGAPLEDALSTARELMAETCTDRPLSPAVASIARGDYRTMEPPAIQGTGYVIESLRAALWALERADSFESAVLAAVNLGDDADTTGAVCGQFAGALYGYDRIPARWRQRITMHDEILGMADRLYELSDQV
jgi:ADP-ribosyl-[dinitrogen reductase] hydrolase